MSRYRRELSVVTAYLLLLAWLALSAPAFYQGDQLRSILVANAPVLITAVGMSLVILARQIDISVGAQLSVCAVAAGLLAQAGLPMPLVALGAVGIGATLGAINGLLIAGLKLPSIVVTLATFVILRDGLRWWREGEFVKGLPDNFQWFGLTQSVGQWLVVSIALLVFAVAAWSLRNLAAGRYVYATGADPEAAWLAGIRPNHVVFWSFVLLGMLNGLAALLGAIRMPQVDPKEGEGLELQVIAAVVVGGVSISGGKGTLVGPLLGVALLGTIRSALVFLGFEAHWDKALQGAIILVAVVADAIKPRSANSGGGR